MNKNTLSLICGLCLLSPGAVFAADAAKPATGDVTVVFSNPEQFSDVKDAFVPTDRGRDAILADIREFVIDRASSFLKKGQKLEVKFTNIDLAGEFEPQLGPGYDSVRILKDIYIPKFDLEFKLTGADGRVLNEGTRKLRDMAYLQRIVLDRNEPLCHEKELLNDWLSSDVKSAAAANR